MCDVYTPYRSSLSLVCVSPAHILPAIVFRVCPRVCPRVCLRVCAVLERVGGTTGEPVDIYARPDPLRVRAALQESYDRGIRCAAVCFIHAYAFPDHERVRALLLSFFHSRFVCSIPSYVGVCVAMLIWVFLWCVQLVGQIAAEVGFTHVSLSHEVMQARHHLSSLSISQCLPLAVSHCVSPLCPFLLACMPACLTQLAFYPAIVRWCFLCMSVLYDSLMGRW